MVLASVLVLAKITPGNAAVPPNAAYFLQGEAFGVRQLAAAFNKDKTLKSGSKLPHSEGALRAQKVCGISRCGSLSFIMPAMTPALAGISTITTGASDPKKRK